jgi:glycosyltransferase involved in cell wall biosynthesis
MATGAAVHQIRARSPHDPLLFPRLVKTIRSVDPEVVQVWLRQMDILGGLAALILRKPLVLTERSSRAAYPRSVKHVLRLRIGSFASAVVANSEAGERYWRGRINRHGRSCMISNAVPVGEIALAPPVRNIIAGDKKLVLFAGRMEPEKNIDVLLPALLMTLDSDDFDIVFCGEGSLKPRIAEWIDRNALGHRARVLGYTPTLWGLMKRASVLVSPARFEGAPNVVLEAMACRCPLVVSDIPEHREFLDERAALFAHPGSPAEIAAAIRTALADPDAARVRATAAFARLERFDPPSIARQYLDLYRTILREPRVAVRPVSA